MNHEHGLLSNLDMSSMCAATNFIQNILKLMPVLYLGLLFDDSTKDARKVSDIDITLTNHHLAMDRGGAFCTHLFNKPPELPILKPRLSIIRASKVTATKWQHNPLSCRTSRLLKLSP